MVKIVVFHSTQVAPSTSPLMRLGWFIGIWAGSVAALGIVAYAIRFALK